MLHGSLQNDAFVPSRNGEHWAAFPQTALHFDPTGTLSATVLADLGATTLIEIDGQRVTVGEPAGNNAPSDEVSVALDATALTVYTRT